jgi:leader peptidase (prepilin peptidase) / N-methyltransferase
VGGGFLFLVSEFYIRFRKKVGLGVGDIKLLAMVGAFFGPEAAIYTIFVGSLFGSIFGVAIIVMQGQKVSHPIPFGPYLAVGTVLYLFEGMELLTKARELVLTVLGTFS